MFVCVEAEVIPFRWKHSVDEDEIIDQPGLACGIDSRPESGRETEGREEEEV